MAVGWRVLSCFGIAGGISIGITSWNAQYYNPLIGAYLRKYKDCTKTDLFEIKDRLREYYEIDDSQYMAYTEEDLKHEHMHANHGPQPDGYVLDSSYLAEMEKFESTSSLCAAIHSCLEMISCSQADSIFVPGWQGWLQAGRVHIACQL